MIRLANGVDVPLSPQQIEIASMLLANEGKFVPTAELAHKMNTSLISIRVQVFNMRDKAAKAGAAGAIDSSRKGYLWTAGKFKIVTKEGAAND